MNLINLTPGTYYQDVLADGSRSIIRSKWPTVQRTSYDRRAAVIQTLKIIVEDLHADQQAMQERFISTNRPSLRTEADMVWFRETIQIPAIQKIRNRVPSTTAAQSLEGGMIDAKSEAERLFK
jgi:hypothetical protein